MSMTVEALAEHWKERADALSTNDPISRRHAMTLRQCAADLAEILATPQPAGCGACGDDCKDRGSCRLADESPKPAGAVPDPLDAAIAKGTKAWTGVPDSFVEDLRGEGAGRADAVPDGRQEFEKWAQKRHGLSVTRWDDSGEYTSHLTRNWWQCWTESRSTIAAAPQPMTTQGEAVATVCLIGERYAHGTMIEVQLQIVPGTELPIGTKLYTGSQP